MSNAFDDFKKWYNSMQSPERQQGKEENHARVRRNIRDALQIMNDLEKGKITEEEAKERAKALYDRTYKHQTS